MSLLNYFKSLQEKFSEGNMSVAVIKTTLSTMVTPDHIKALHDKLSGREKPESDGGWLQADENKLMIITTFVAEQPTLFVAATKTELHNGMVQLRFIHKATTIDETFALLQSL